MKYTLFFSATFLLIVLPVFGELTPQDLDKIRLIVKEEVAETETRLIAAIAQSESNMKSYVDIKFDGVSTRFDGVRTQVSTQFEEFDKRLTLVVGFVTALIILIVVTVGIPQIIIAWRGKNEQAQNRKIEELAREIEALKQKHIISP